MIKVSEIGPKTPYKGMKRELLPRETEITMEMNQEQVVAPSPKYTITTFGEIQFGSREDAIAFGTSLKGQPKDAQEAWRRLQARVDAEAVARFVEEQTKAQAEASKAWYQKKWVKVLAGAVAAVGGVYAFNKFVPVHVSFTNKAAIKGAEKLRALEASQPAFSMDAPASYTNGQF